MRLNTFVTKVKVGVIFFSLLSGLMYGTALAQQTTVSGTVTNAQTGEPVEAVNIIVRGTNIGTATNAEGNYTLEVPSLQDTLVFSFIGYESEVVPIRGRAEINVQLQPTTIMAEELVVVGFGTQQVQDLTGSVATVSTEMLENRPATNTTLLLQGTMAGVQVTQSSGRPGHEGTEILIRGLGTMNDSSPLVLINGLEGNLSNVNPNDIASISVLKGAAAAAIYGARAANGVVLVTTKQGQPGTTNISYHGYAGMQQVAIQPQKLGSAKFAKLYNEALINEGLQPRYTKEDIRKFKSGKYPYTHANTQWVDLVLQGSGIIHSHNLTFSGGNKKTQYYASLAYNKQYGIVERTDQTQYYLRLNLDTDLNEWFTAGANLGLTRSHVTNPTVPRASWSFPQVFRQAHRMRPTIVNKFKNGDWGRYSDGNPVAWIKDGGLQQVYRSHLLGKLYGEIEFMENLSLDLTMGFEYGIVDSKAHVKVIEYHNGSTQGPTSLTNSVNREQTVTLRAILNYEKTYHNHNMNALLGVSRRSHRRRWLSGYRKNFPSNLLAQLNAGSTVGLRNSGRALIERLGSYFARLNYNYDNTYYLQFNIRRDGSSKFKSGERWGIFPSVAAGWIVTNDLFENVSWLNFLKLRASWGKLGNNRIANYQYFSLISTGISYPFGGTIADGIAITQPSNPVVSWETTTQLDIGLNATIFNSLSITADYYNRYTYDILTSIPVSQTFGLPAPLVNEGAMRNRGVELILEYSNNIGGLRYNISANGSYNNNVVVKFANPSEGTRIYAEGISWGAFYGYQVIGKYQTNEAAANLPHLPGAKVAAGDLKFKDVNNDGTIDGKDRVVLGNANPELTYGFSVNLGYKGIGFSAFFQGAARGYKHIGGELQWPVSHFAAAYKRQLDRVITKNGKVVKQGTYPRTLINFTHNKVMSSFEVYNSSYMRLKSLRVSYTLPQEFTSNMGVSNVNLYFSGTNLLTITPFPKIADPVSGANNAYPLLETYTLGLNIEF